MCSKRCVTHCPRSSLWFHICHTVSHLPTSSLILASSRDSSLSFTMALSLWNANTCSSEHLRAVPMDLKHLQYSNPVVQLMHTHTRTGPGVCNSLSTQCMRKALFWLQKQQDMLGDTARHRATGLHSRGTRETRRGGERDFLTWKVGRYTSQQWRPYSVFVSSADSFTKKCSITTSGLKMVFDYGCVYTSYASQQLRWNQIVIYVLLYFFF